MAARKTKTATVPEGFTPIGQNVYGKLADDGGMFLWFDTGADLGPSASGKSTKVASTGGNVTVAGGVKLGINAYEPKTAL